MFSSIAPVPPAAAVGVLLEVDRRRDADRDDEHGARAPSGRACRAAPIDAGLLRVDARREARQEVPRQPRAGAVAITSMISTARAADPRPTATSRAALEQLTRATFSPRDARPTTRRVAPSSAGRAGHHSYTCLYLRTKRIEMKLRISVIRNSVVPTAKIVWYSADELDTSERRDVGDERGHVLVRLARVDVEARELTAGDEDHDGLADRARGAEHDAGDDAGDRGREDDAQRDLALGRAEAVGALAQRARDRPSSRRRRPTRSSAARAGRARCRRSAR